VAETKKKKRRILLGLLLDWRYTRPGNVTEIHADWKFVNAADKFLAYPDQTRGDSAAPLVCMGNGAVLRSESLLAPWYGWCSLFSCICIVHKFDSIYV
jgi:hypothetical protein